MDQDGTGKRRVAALLEQLARMRPALRSASRWATLDRLAKELAAVHGLDPAVVLSVIKDEIGEPVVDAAAVARARRDTEADILVRSGDDEVERH